jgi:hypothetical protein
VELFQAALATLLQYPLTDRRSAENPTRLPASPDTGYSNRTILNRSGVFAQGLPPAQVISYLDLIAGRMGVGHIPPTALVRIESPGKDFQVERALLMLGAEEPDPDGREYERLSRTTLEMLSEEKGRILPSRQWYLGYSALLRQIAPHLSNARLMNRPEDILLMFDKRACHTLLKQHGLAVAPALEPVQSYDELLEKMRQQGWRRVFLKLAHGSSASGVVAYRYRRDQHQAITTVEMVRGAHEIRLYNSRKIRTYRDQTEIATLIDSLCRHRVHVEQWIPKAMYHEQVFDLRVVVIAGQVRHIVPRLSKNPLTNLHLLNERGDVEVIKELCGLQRWQLAMQECERAASLFPSLYTGIDLLFSTHFTQHILVEMNAFGDLLPGIIHNGQDTYTAEICAALQQERYRNYAQST